MNTVNSSKAPVASARIRDDVTRAPPATLLVRRAEVLVTMDADRREIPGGSILLEGDTIARVGPDAEVAQWIAENAPARNPDRIIDASGCVVLPGLINCHHHLFQSLTRTIGTGQGRPLFDWLRLLYPIWAEMDPEAVYVSAKTALAELILSGATTVADHLYLFPNGARLDDEIQAAREMGVRFHATRGSMSLGESKGGLPPDRIVEGRRRHPCRLPARDRGVPRSASTLDVAHRPGALFAFQRDAGSHARNRAAGA